MRPYFSEGGITIYNGDCREVLPTLSPVDLVVTSPPYGNQRSYDSSDGFVWDDVVPPAIAGINLSEAGQILVNLGIFHKNGDVVQYWDSLIAAMRSSGYRLFGWYPWDQGAGLPGRWSGHFAPSHEWLFHFNRVGVEPKKFVECLHAGAKHTGSQVKSRSGVATPKSGLGRTVSQFKIPDSVIRIGRLKGNKTGHPAAFPVALPEFLIRAWDGIVLDPFMGSGSTLIAARNQNRSAIGIELNERYCEIAADRIRKVSNCLSGSKSLLNP